ISTGETRTPEFLEKVNANGRIPVLETEEGEFLAESNAILFYLAEGTSFPPEGRMEKARALRWMFFEQYSHEPNIAVARAWLHVFDVEMTEERRNALQSKQKLGYDALGVMETHLKVNDFFVGGRYSIADIALYAYTHVAGEGGFDLEGFPAVRAWLERVSSQPGYIPITQG
ncbi:MAG TPA: glutathione S-transferase family protein, partial [Rubrobacter sp.]|nr:glutathione S-transferase family protein [Rubrobacter sp.]